MINKKKDLPFVDDDLTFAEGETTSAPQNKHTWKIMLVDDEAEIHHVTRLSLADFTFEGKGLTFISAYSGQEARQLIQQHPDTALILLDVVMETDDAGLAVAKFIRETVGNEMVRIVLRTGQPGQAPEREVVVNYDINDYKAKTELTNQKLFTTMVAGLRAFRHILTIETQRRENAELYARLEEFNRTLEQKVEERTAQLIQAHHEAQEARAVADAAREREEQLQQQVTALRLELDKDHTLLWSAFEQTPPFDFLTDPEKSWLAERVQPVSFPGGWSICDPNDTDYDVLYLLFEGRVAIRKADGGVDSLLGYIKAPAYFGELAVFFNQPRSVRVIADGPTHCFTMAGEDVRALVAQNSMFSQSFATMLRNKQRIFQGYETFVNLLFSQVDEGVIELRRLVEAYRGLRSILHRAGSPHELDLDALAYVIPRLPDTITSTLSLYLTEDLPEMYRQVRDKIRAPSRRAKKREFYEILPNKLMVLLRDRMTDTVDLITKLCIYAVESGKIRDRLIDTPLASRITHLVLYGDSSEEAKEIITALPFIPEEITHLEQLFGDKLLQRLYEILVQVGDLSIYVQPSDHRYTKSASELWLSQIRQGLWQVITPEEFNQGLEVHIISSNTHSVPNCLSPWLHERTETILNWAAETMPTSLTLAKSTDRLYLASRAWAEVHPEEAAQRLESDRAHGIHLLDDATFTGIEVSLIDANCLGDKLDPAIGATALDPRTLIINIDYAYGQQAELIMRSLILLFSQRIRSISIFGKSGAIVGQRGDLLLPDRLLLQTDDHLYPIPNRDLTPADFQVVGCDRPVHQGTLLTVLGTIMQSREMLYYYRHFWNTIGMEMEGSFYLREIERARSLGLIPEDVRLRLAYYTSDTPLEPHASLTSNLSAEEGIPPVYAITRAVLRRIFNQEVN